MTLFSRASLESNERFAFAPSVVNIRCPKVFSMIENPEGTVRVLDRLVNAVRNSRVREIHIDQSAVERTDLCASAVLNALCSSAQSELHAMYYSPPNDDEALEIVLATGLPQHFGNAAPTQDRITYFTPVQAPPFSLIEERAQLKSVVATNVINYLDSCYQTCGYSLNDSAQEHLASLLSEVLGNSEDHTETGMWWVSAYFRRTEARYGDCHLTLFNLGRTIAESMSQTPPDSRARRISRRVLGTLQAAGRFGKAYTEESFWTLIALQPMVTSKESRATVDKDRGTGTIRIMEAFLELGGTSRPTQPPIMAIVSGRTHIKMDGSYRLEEVTSATGVSRRQISFNRERSLGVPPDPQAVRTMRGRFPGTLLSLRFYIDPDHLNILSSYVAPYAGPR